MGSPVAAVLLAATLALSARLIGWLAEPTAAGVRVRAAADAYREHLATARPSRWSAATPPPFAYALALGITPTWSDLTEAGALTPRTAFRPFWWSRDDWNDSSFADLSTSLPSAVASATSSSSSGSSGSGSSGGGGGGGGGGGW
jgi:uncharacterized membrane protein YgcG